MFKNDSNIKTQYNNPLNIYTSILIKRYISSRFVIQKLPVQVPQTLRSLETYMIVNFMTCKINQDT